MAAIQLVQALAAATPLNRIDDYHAEFPSGYYNTVRSILVEEFGSVIEKGEADPNTTPIEIFVEYIGQCRKRDDRKQQTMTTCSTCSGSGILVTNSPVLAGGMRTCSVCRGSGRSMSVTNSVYASAWVDGGWHARFPENVLKAFFGEPEAAFDGDFYRYLLSSKDLSKSYKQLARKYHPDMGGRVEQFHKLREAYDTLKDPLTRKRYEAGLKFQQTATKENEVVFRIPKSCGRLLVKGTWGAVSGPIWGQQTRSQYGKGRWQDIDEDVVVGAQKRLNVTEIIEWRDIYDDRGRMMVARWKGGDIKQGFKQFNQQNKPFVVDWEDQEELVINVTV